MVYLVRGLPNTGKTTFAKSLGIYHIEADMFFMRNGVYTFYREFLPVAHQWCQKMFRDAVNMGLDVVVSNTFTTDKELQPYIRYVKEHKIPYKVLRTLGVERGDNGHNVPADVITKMKVRFEDVEGEEYIE
jgi:tRNA uridine 5-carbamoylmethylation protein Kti12